MFSTVADAGVAGDYKGLQAAMASAVYAAGDSRLTATQSNQAAALTSLSGSPGVREFDIFLDYDGVAPTTLQPISQAVTEGFSLHNNTTGQNTFFPTGTAGQSFVLNPLAFSVPEPATLGVLAFGGLLAARRRRA